MMRKISSVVSVDISALKRVGAKTSSVPNNLSLYLNEDDPSDVCQLQESPLYIFKACVRGQLTVVEQLLNADESRLNTSDEKGWTCLHHATYKSQLKVMAFLIDKGCDINARDSKGNTALHLAVELGDTKTVAHLLINGADGNIPNSKHDAPLHVAVMNNEMDTITELTRFPDKVNINMGGHDNATAMHIAGFCDLPDLERGAQLLNPCIYGFYPMHLAAKNGAASALQRMLEVGQKMGYASTEILNAHDKENNLPLHSAVNSGDIKTVQVCLRYGARIDLKLDDLSTAFHLAASQGTLEIVKIMLESHRKMTGNHAFDVLSMRDILNMTPLHRAAMFDHPEVVRYLLQQGSDANALDKFSRSPMLLAAIRSGLASIRILMENKMTSLMTIDKEKRNILHFLVLYSESVRIDKEIRDICRLAQDTGCKVELLNQKDINGCTALHLASKHGKERIIKLLVDLGVKINEKDNMEQTALHFASRYGNVKSARQLLSCSLGPNMINDVDIAGLTALHVSSQNGHAELVELFLHKGALLHKDFFGRTPLHLATNGGHTSTIQLLLAFHANLLDQRDSEGNTALHYAAIANHPRAVDVLLSHDCVYETNDQNRTPLDIATESYLANVATVMISHDRWHEILSHSSEPFLSPLYGLIQLLPQVYKQVLDRCKVIPIEIDPSSEDYYEKFDFTFMQISREKQMEEQKLPENKYNQDYYKPLMALNTMVKFGRIELLSHPVCLHFINMKWRAYGMWLYILNLVLYIFFIVSLTHLIMMFNPGNDVNGFEDDFVQWQLMGFTTLIAQLYIIIYVIFCLIKEVREINNERIVYFADFLNYAELTLYLSSGLFVIPIFFGHFSTFQWECATVAIFFAWFNLLLYLQRLESVGIYVVMFMHILSTVLRVMFVFTVLFIAFGFAFFMLLMSDKNGNFSNPFISTVQALMATISGMEFIDIYVERYQQGTLPHVQLNFFFLFLFVLFMSILFINMLIGLAVGDIEIVRRNAKLKRLEKQIEYHTDLERRLSSWLLNIVDKTQLTIYPNKKPIGVYGFFLVIVNTMTSKGFFSKNNHLESFSNLTYHDDSNCHTALLNEFNKTKNRFNEVQEQLDKQNDLLSLIAQNLGISVENEQFDDE